MSTKERVIPSKFLLNWRKEFLLKLRMVKPAHPQCFSDICLSPGNSKLGKTGKFYKSVFVWNLPSVVTCPGASSWCLTHCYNADAREAKFPVEEWLKNWWMTLNRPEILKDTIAQQIVDAEKPCAIRIHSSGDFYSKAYINFWIDIISSVDDTFFWAYTRSWADTDLFPVLDKLRSIKNMELFASWDSTMKDYPPTEWRRSYVYIDISSAQEHRIRDSRAFICPEQEGTIQDCASCGFCMRKLNKDILFYFH